MIGLALFTQATNRKQEGLTDAVPVSAAEVVEHAPEVGVVAKVLAGTPPVADFRHCGNCHPNCRSRPAERKNRTHPCRYQMNFHKNQAIHSLLSVYFPQCRHRQAGAGTDWRRGGKPQGRAFRGSLRARLPMCSYMQIR